MKYLVFIFLLFALNVQSQKTLEQKVHSYFYNGTPSDTITNNDTIWNWFVRPNKQYYTSIYIEVNLDKISGNPNMEVFMQGKVNQGDDYIDLDSITWYGYGSDTSIIFDRTDQIDKYRYYQIHIDANTTAQKSIIDIIFWKFYERSLNSGQIAFGSIGNLSKTLNETFEINKHGCSTIAFHIVPPTNGTIIFEATFDGTNWEAITFRSITNDIIANNSTSEEDIIGSVAGVMRFRFRTSVEGSANGTVIGNLVKNVSILEGIEFNAPPHRFGFDPVHKDINLTDAATDTAIWITAIGKRFAVTDITVLASGSTDGILKIYAQTDVSGNYLFNSAIEVSTNKMFVYPKSFITPFIATNVNDTIFVTTSAGLDVNILLHGYEY